MKGSGLKGVSQLKGSNSTGELSKPLRQLWWKDPPFRDVFSVERCNNYRKYYSYNRSAGQSSEEHALLELNVS